MFTGKNVLTTEGYYNLFGNWLHETTTNNLKDEDDEKRAYLLIEVENNPLGNS